MEEFGSLSVISDKELFLEAWCVQSPNKSSDKLFIFRQSVRSVLLAMLALFLLGLGDLVSGNYIKTMFNVISNCKQKCVVMMSIICTLVFSNFYIYVLFGHEIKA